MKPWLLLDTATPTAVVGVWADDGVRAELQLAETRRHAESLIDAIDRALLMAEVGVADLAGVAVGRGPGSFIGVRTGIATAKGICLARELPLVGVSTLLALALSVEGLPEGPGLVVVDAKRGEVYAQRVERHAGGVRPLEEAQALPPDEAHARARALAFRLGSGLPSDDTLGGGGPIIVAQTGPTARGLSRALSARLADGAIDETDSLVPDYCRAPDAKLPAVDPAARRHLAG